MNNIEYEKAARGPLYPAATAEYAWGTTAITGCAAAGISGAEDGTETCTTANSRVTYNNITFTTTGDLGAGPTRAGMYAKSTTTDRLSAGAGYWGILDLTGNVQEMIVNIGTVTGRNFAGTHGDGTLTTLSTFEGNATNFDWPGLSATTDQGVTTAAGSGVKGGSWNEATVARLAIGDRNQIASAPSTRTNTTGGRGVRTASA